MHCCHDQKGRLHAETAYLQRCQYDREECGAELGRWNHEDLVAVLASQIHLLEEIGKGASITIVELGGDAGSAGFFTGAGYPRAGARL